ncbi:DUF1206 domain-containing protein [Hamadaea tsunoensis]|uniref:DUF1206 domain-containing protein n=1 Tax=Hamadaea tsunoensis TaxID=53368 RepID=UPI0003F51EF2|nr:DUF1206 domain-containing protein [Hamadaea tsunoensis]
MTSTLEHHATRAARSSFLEWPTRIGFVGYGLLHLALAWLAVQILLGRGGHGDEGQTGALRTLAAQPLGRFLMIVIIVGLFAMAVWQLLLAFVGHREEQGKRRLAERALSGVRSVLYGALAITAWKVLQGTATTSARQQQDFTATVLHKPFGQTLVVIAGGIVVIAGIAVAIYGLRTKFLRRLKTGRMSPAVKRTATNLGRIGYLGKGIAFTVVGILVVTAGITYDPAKSGGLDTALKTLAQAPYGPVLLLVVALGFAAFGIYCFFQSKYRKV